MLSPKADNTAFCETPALLLKSDMILLLSTEVAMITRPLPLANKACAKGLGLLGSNAGSASFPSLPADATITIPASVARFMAARSVLLAPPAPPNEILITRARLSMARLTPAAIAESKNEHAASSSPTSAMVQLPAWSARRANMVAL